MRKICFIVFIALSAVSVTVKAAVFDLVTPGSKVTILYAEDDRKLCLIAAHLLAQDIERVTGYLPEVVTDISKVSGNVIIIGTVRSRLIKHINKAYFNGLHGKWECYAYKLLPNLNRKVKNALIIAGSDLRGTAYGVFGISEKIGVTPWYWWADATPVKQQQLSLDINDFTSRPPSVQYRGIFINDEDWGLQPWAAKTFEPETGDIGPKTYEKVFELLLRLKANLIWPAMHPSTKAFYYYPGNKQVAADYEIIVGSSHAEPMLRNNVDEWNEKKRGDFNYVTNKANVLSYWESRVKESSMNNAIYTVGMRGVHDSGMKGVKSTEEAASLLESIFEDQRNLLRKHISPDVASVPQAFTLYKEVLGIYENGLKVPEDITLVWPDDNYGYIRRLGNSKENARKGGAGVYYHASYWGRPHDYLWLSTTHPALISEEMTKAHEMGAAKIWVLNVGDIKPLEYNIELFLDMAYDIAPFKSPDYTREHMRDWTSGIFGKKNSEAITEVLWQYYQLAFERRPEFMGWSRTEPTTHVNFTGYNHSAYGDEAQKRIDRYHKLQQRAASLSEKIVRSKIDAFYELVYYPVKCASLMNKKFLYRDKAYLYAKQERLSAQEYYRLSKSSYDEIREETRYFNNTLAEGKWNGIMSMEPRDLPVYQFPELKLHSPESAAAFHVRPEGLPDSVSGLAPAKRRFELPAFNKYCAQKYFIEVYLSKEARAEYHVIPSADWIKISKTGGTLMPAALNSQERIWVEIDWSKVPPGNSIGGTITVKSGSEEYEVAVKAENKTAGALQDFNGFIECDGYISINASSYSRTGNNGDKRWETTEGLGSDKKMLEALPLTAVVDSSHDAIMRNPYVEYDFYNFSASAAEINVYSLPTLPLNNNYEMRYAVQIDNGPLHIVNFKTVGRSEEWKENVLRNNALKTVTIPELKSGKHRLRIYIVDPGVILDKIFISLDDRRLPYGDTEETRLSVKM